MDFSNVNPFIRYAGTSHETFSPSGRYAHDCRIFCLLSGTADVYTRDKHFAMKPNSILFVAADNMYNIVSDGVNMSRINFDFDQSNNSLRSPFIAKNTNEKLPDEKYKAFIPEGYPPYIFIEDSSRCATEIGKIVNEFWYKRTLYQGFASALLKELLIQIYRLTYGSKPQLPEAVISVIRYINENYTHTLSNSVLSEISGYNERHLNRLFVTHTGVSLHKYIINRRMEEASYLLIYSDLSISAVSEQAGFANLSNFSVSFKEHTGMTPSDYRKKLRNIY